MFGFLMKKEKERREKFTNKQYMKEIASVEAMLTEGEEVIAYVDGLKNPPSKFTLKEVSKVYTAPVLITLTNKRLIVNKEGRFNNVFEQHKLDAIDSATVEMDGLFRIHKGSAEYEYSVALPNKHIVDKMLNFIRNQGL